jgi:hypothetical protein
MYDAAMRAALAVSCSLLTVACAAAAAQDSRGDSQPRPIQVSGILVLPAGVPCEMFEINRPGTDRLDSYGPLESPTVSFKTAPGPTWIRLKLAHWYLQVNGGRMGPIFSERIEVDPDADLRSPMVWDIRPFVQTIWVTVRDEAGAPIDGARVGPSNPSNLEGLGGGRLDTFTIVGGKNGKIPVVMPRNVGPPDLVVFKPGFDSARLRKARSEQEVVLQKRGVPIDFEFCDWLLADPVAKKMSIVFDPVGSGNWWKVLEASTNQPAGLQLQPGEYAVRYSFDLATSAWRMSAGIDRATWDVAMPRTLHVPDGREPVKVKIDPDRKRFEEGVRWFGLRPESGPARK